ncbi:hypothetical protein NLJ89_g281 [Agrocybe chaxingu]|uniref:Protein kinase domain-containing protein n=1 Tax=Agrocybe chaxingu TaxID=84603 RepID=A0A9W8N293_9AGAR|nr:hypothetical protein NLJ89_g281 [Agrocybe chaxingu]
MALRVLEASTGALNIAASLCGIPFVGAIAIAVEEIVKTCGEVKTHKVELFGRDWISFPLTLVLQQKSKQLSNRCVQILNTLNEQSSKMEGSKLQQITDQLLPILEKVLDRTRKWAKYNPVVTFLKNGEIKDGLDLCDIELNSAMTLFHIKYLQYQRGLINLHRETGVPPTIKVLNGEVTKHGDLAIAGGVYSDIWAGKWLGEEKVALKALRNIRATDAKAKKVRQRLLILGETIHHLQRFENEIKLWANLKHNNILPFYGIVTDLGQHIHMVSPWQENGNVLEYDTFISICA